MLGSTPGLYLPAPSVTTEGQSPWEGTPTRGGEAPGRGKVSPAHTGSGSSLHGVPWLSLRFRSVGEGVESPPQCSGEVKCTSVSSVVSRSCSLPLAPGQPASSAQVSLRLLSPVYSLGSVPLLPPVSPDVGPPSLPVPSTCVPLVVRSLELPLSALPPAASRRVSAVTPLGSRNCSAISATLCQALLPRLLPIHAHHSKVAVMPAARTASAAAGWEARPHTGRPSGTPTTHGSFRSALGLLPSHPRRHWLLVSRSRLSRRPRDKHPFVFLGPAGQKSPSRPTLYTRASNAGVRELLRVQKVKSEGLRVRTNNASELRFPPPAPSGSLLG